ncbi:hypothetical protein [Streptomyces sp. GESEQ-35]|uniref:hypothetical protein n=1 Tax=Streptomyces sp. GESEQ-35 TaxID=2812657 RepID=UPI001B33789B|nr:hypothetical protein [Streptomyces sp. GESEQ-35]
MLRGEAFMAVWHDIQTEDEVEYNQWHTVQHMPERVGVPGFTAGRRYVDWNLPLHRYFTLYEGERLDTFSSEPYRERLNNPTEWTTRMQPHFTNFVRSACTTLSTSGIGFGGALLTIRAYSTGNGRAALEEAAGSLQEQLSGQHGVTGIHLGWAEPETTRVRTAETDLRRLTGEEVFDAVLMVEGIGRREVEAVTPSAQKLLGQIGGIRDGEAAVYDLAYLLTSQEL